MPSIEYTLHGKRHLYHPDIYLPFQRLIIEVKSDYTFSLEREKTKAKMMTASVTIPSLVSTGFTCTNALYDCHDHGYCNREGTACICDKNYATHDCDPNVQCCYPQESRVKMFLFTGRALFRRGRRGYGRGNPPALLLRLGLCRRGLRDWCCQGERRWRRLGCHWYPDVSRRIRLVHRLLGSNGSRDRALQ
jgi:hypothetical protein